MKCIIYVGLSDTKGKSLAWDNNLDNHYRMSMNFIQRVRFIHSEFEKNCGGDKINFTIYFQKECCMQIVYQINKKINSKCGIVNTHIFRGIDNIFQLAFITREICELINNIVSMWENIGIKNQKVKKFKPLICGNIKSNPEMK